MTKTFDRSGARFTKICVLGFVAVTALSGCAEFLAARELRAQGWREAQIVQVAPGAVIARRSFRDCRKEADLETAARGIYVVYRYNVAGRPAFRIAPLLDEWPLNVGDRVYVNIDDCLSRPMPR